jgi:sec-independent protein translocase protein TatA
MFRNPTVDILIVLLIVLLIWGPKRLPTLGRELGKGLREFKESITGESKDDEPGERPEITQTSATSATPAPPVGTAPERESAEARTERHS